MVLAGRGAHGAQDAEALRPGLSAPRLRCSGSVRVTPDPFLAYGAGCLPHVQVAVQSYAWFTGFVGGAVRRRDRPPCGEQFLDGERCLVIGGGDFHDREDRVARELGVEAAFTSFGGIGYMRLSAHVYNTAADYEYFAEECVPVLGTWARQSTRKRSAP